MSNKLQKVINISKKTGDRIIVFDGSEDDNPYVVMSLDDYEKITVKRSGVGDLTEDELLDKINRDIAIWKSENEEVPLARKTKQKRIENNDFYKDNEDSYEDDYEDDYNNKEEINKNDIVDFDEDEDTYYYEEKEDSNSFGRRVGKSGNIWKIPKNIKKSAEEVM